MDSPTPSDSPPPFGPLLASAYARHWLDHSASLGRHFHEIARQFQIFGEQLCDVACGEGTFAIGMAKNGWRVTGVDLSTAMLALAEMHAKKHGVNVTWFHGDMREFTLPEPVDLVTCWYNSLNYLLTERDVARAFGAMYRALVTGGWLLFDVYTLYGLETEWANRAWIAVDAEDCFDASQTRYDPRTRRAEVTFTGFLREKTSSFARFDEHHHHRGYTWTTLRQLLHDAGFEVRAPFTVPGLAEPDQRSKRIYIAARKK